MIAGAASPTRLRAAQVLRAHGLRGEVRAEPCGGGAERFTKGLQLHLENAPTVLTVRAARRGPDGTVLLGFDAIDDADAAAALRGMYLCVDVTAARALGDDEWFVWQLVGLRVVSAAGARLGDVVDVESAVGNDVLVVRSGSGERRFPMVRDFINSVDVSAGVVIVTPWDEDEA